MKTIRRYSEVVAALRDPRMELGVADAGLHLAARVLFAGVRIEDLPELAAPVERPLDLVASLAAPWSLRVAAVVTGASEPDRLATLAREVFLAGAVACSERASGAVTALSEVLRTPIAVQAFVALSQTLPAFLAGAWLVLLETPDIMRELREDPSLMPAAIEELLRLAGPSRAVFRTLDGERVGLLLNEANRDPEVFPDPHRLILRRSGPPHVAFGAGTHACAGAALIRLAAQVALSGFVANFADAKIQHVEWLDEPAIRAPSRLVIS